MTKIRLLPFFAPLVEGVEDCLTLDGQYFDSRRKNKIAIKTDGWIFDYFFETVGANFDTSGVLVAQC